MFTLALKFDKIMFIAQLITDPPLAKGLFPDMSNLLVGGDPYAYAYAGFFVVK